MDLQNFAPIGQAALVQALGVQQNYIKHKTITILDVNATNCICCDTYKMRQLFEKAPESDTFKMCNRQCENCPKKVLKQVTTSNKQYINESNLYGYSKRLKINAYKQFVVYHFMRPNRLGFVLNINTKDFAKLLNVDVKTIHNNNKILREYNYIAYTDSKDKTNFNIQIKNYSSYFLPASNGGRGYLTLNKELLNELIKIKNINSLRLQLRQLLEYESLSLLEEKKSGIVKTYKELTRMLPAYCKRNVIKKILSEETTSIFKIFTDNNGVRFKLNTIFDAKSIKKAQFSSTSDLLKRTILNINQEFMEYNKSDAKIAFSNNKFINFIKQDHYDSIILTDQDYKDLTTMALEYSYTHVIDALVNVYHSFINSADNEIKKSRIKNICGLVRETVKKLVNLPTYEYVTTIS